MTTLTTLEKFTKAEAFNEILKLKESAEFPGHNVLDKLLNYFAAPVPKKPKSAEQWVGKACNPKDIREMCHYIHVKNGEALATDGHRMHWGDTDLPDGFYDPKTLLPVDRSIHDFASHDFNRVKKINTNKTCSFNLLFADNIIESDNKGKPKQVTILGEAGAINTKYLNDATNGDNKTPVIIDADWKVVDGLAPTNGCSGKSEFGNFRIMGMRL